MTCAEGGSSVREEGGKKGWWGKGSLRPKAGNHSYRIALQCKTSISSGDQQGKILITPQHLFSRREYKREKEVFANSSI